MFRADMEEALKRFADQMSDIKSKLKHGNRDGYKVGTKNSRLKIVVPDRGPLPIETKKNKKQIRNIYDDWQPSIEGK